MPEPVPLEGGRMLLWVPPEAEGPAEVLRKKGGPCFVEDDFGDPVEAAYDWGFPDADPNNWLWRSNAHGA